MAAFLPCNNTTKDIFNAVHDFDSHALFVLLTSTMAATTVLKGSITGETSGSGYTAGGKAVTGGSTTTVTTNDAQFACASLVWTAGGNWASGFQYPVLWNDTPTSPADPTIGYYDYGSSISLLNGETFTWTPGATLFTLTV